MLEFEFQSKVSQLKTYKKANLFVFISQLYFMIGQLYLRFLQLMQFFIVLGHFGFSV
jgi:hypothetical protein